MSIPCTGTGHRGLLSTTTYALEPVIVHPELQEVLPIALGFIRRQDGTKKYDCEQNATVRVTDRLRSE